MRCPSCGKVNDSDAARCVNCGRDLRAGAPARNWWLVVALAAALGGVLTLGFLSPLGVLFGLIALIASLRHPSRRFDRALATVALAISVGTLALVVPVYLRTWAKASHENCLCSIEQLTLSSMMYAQENDGCYPLAHNWCDATFPYSKTEAVYDCWSGRYPRSDYVYNQAMSGMRADEVVSPDRTVLIFDGVAGWNASGGIERAEYRHPYDSHLRCAVAGMANGSRRSLVQDASPEWWDPLAPDKPALPPAAVPSDDR